MAGSSPPRSSHTKPTPSHERSVRALSPALCWTSLMLRCSRHDGCHCCCCGHCHHRRRRRRRCRRCWLHDCCGEGQPRQAHTQPDWVSWRRRPPGRGTPRWHNRQRLRGARHRLQIVCARRRHRRCCRRLRRRRGALRLSRRSRGREAHVAAHQPRLPLESELRRRPRRGHRAVELQVDREQPKPRDQVTPRCAGAATRRAAYPPRSSSLTPPRPA